MNKKGSHVDWAISIGIFLVYIVGLFILLRPGVTPAYKPENLLKLIEDKVNEEVMWEVREVPLVLDYSCSAGYDIRTLQNVERPTITVDVKGNWSTSDKMESENIEKVKWNGEVLTSAEDNSQNDIPKGSYFIKLSPKSKEAGEPTIGISEAKPSQCHIDENEKIRASLGASTFKNGVNDRYWNVLKTELESKSIEDIKAYFGLPEETNFQILIDGGNYKNEKLSETMEEPYSQANVFTKQIKSWILKPDGSFSGDSVEITIKVW